MSAAPVEAPQPAPAPRPVIKPIRGRVFVERMVVRPSRSIVLTNANGHEIEDPLSRKFIIDDEDNRKREAEFYRCFVARVLYAHPDDTREYDVETGMVALVRQHSSKGRRWTQWDKDFEAWDRKLSALRLAYRCNQWVNADPVRRTMEDFAPIVGMTVGRLADIVERREAITPIEATRANQGLSAWMGQPQGNVPAEWSTWPVHVNASILDIQTPDDVGAPGLAVYMEGRRIIPWDAGWCIYPEDNAALTELVLGRPMRTGFVTVVPPEAILCALDGAPQDGEIS